MKTTLYKRVVFAILALILCLGCTACGEEQAEQKTGGKEKAPAATKKEENKTEQSAPEVPNQAPYDQLPYEELQGKIGAWLGWSETGTLTERDQYSIVKIKSKKDLDPYRTSMFNFSAEDEKKILEGSGTCVLVELTGATEHTLYGTSSIMRGGNTITIIVSTDEVEDILPKYTFFLLYFPEEYYNGEIIDLAF
ncbi:MAG: hypothetical protein E7580_02670 [Ruminococcaceae bacterium]|nr:hypothetical protein [Oscillospiraceae bacterium]